MNWQTFLLWIFIICGGTSVFGAWLAWATRKNGKETRKVIQENHKETIRVLEKIDATQRQNHEETIKLLEKIDTTQRQNHEETIKLLEKIDTTQRQNHHETMQVLNKIAELLDRFSTR